MNSYSSEQLWERFKAYFLYDSKTKFSLDVSRMMFTDDFLESHRPEIEQALVAMNDLEKGSIANPDEGRMVGHYWLRAPELAPEEDIRKDVKETVFAIKKFSKQVLWAKIKPETKERFRYILVIGIGGSALGPQFVSHALSNSTDQITPFFIDNTDPDGINRTLNLIPDLAETLTIVISKSGGTKETRNGMLSTKAAYEAKGLNFAKHVVAITGEGSKLDQVAEQESWIARFPMWDWVGGRTSELSAVGLLPAALQGFDIDALLDGAAYMDTLTRNADYKKNPAALMAQSWFYIGSGHGDKAMVVLPYKDRLELFSRYLQQLVMESLGKEKDLDGEIVNQGIAVYGNKGSTDQHAFVQQLRDGRNDFFGVFVEVLQDLSADSESEKPELFEVEPGITSGDYLSGFYQGTRKALFENGRESITITIEKVDAFNVGMLIALFERAVGLYASLVNINAYHQPGVEAGKKAAENVLVAQTKITQFLKTSNDEQSLEQIAAATSVDIETVFKIVQHLVANDLLSATEAESVFESRYSAN
ncbi:MAG: glucose-6-phosphate isomerase [Deltaproteobacteria bacterium]|nr:glucose-6-phosphate isomerase [Deltaproteobacteria bacterium]